MSPSSLTPGSALAQSGSLRALYLLRAGFAFTWLAAALVLGGRSTTLGVLLLSGYVAWDACANLIDIRGVQDGQSVRWQRLNAAISAISALGVAAGLVWGMALAVGVFGAWALGSGLLQLTVALGRRRTSKGQTFMILSGAQSALAGLLFIAGALAPRPAITQIAPYAAFGGLYFLLAAAMLVRWRRPGQDSVGATRGSDMTA